jgi:hypothetical protein
VVGGAGDQSVHRRAGGHLDAGLNAEGGTEAHECYRREDTQHLRGEHPGLDLVHRAQRAEPDGLRPVECPLVSCGGCGAQPRAKPGTEHSSLITNETADITSQEGGGHGGDGGDPGFGQGVTLGHAAISLLFTLLCAPQ